MIRGVHHFGLTVRDVDASAAWYGEVLGFRRAGEFTAPDGARRKVFLRHDGLQVRLGLTQHRHGSKDAFDETRAGLDHLAFAVANREALAQIWLSSAGVWAAGRRRDSPRSVGRSGRGGAAGTVAPSRLPGALSARPRCVRHDGDHGGPDGQVQHDKPGGG
jgi:catechol 2,3-dioxygenase-like lactoylglutathione lyase family enzyme